MKPSFCAIVNRQAGEDLIGTASHYQTYVLIECPLPWAAKTFTSKQIPTALRQYVKAKKAERAIQFLTVSRARPSQSVTLMIYERPVPSAKVAADDGSSAQSQIIQNYRGYEFQLETLDQVVDCLEAHWQGSRIGKPITTKDILICTHGMRDKCCACFGQPLFREATNSVKQGKMPNTRLWRVSHIGGHRFAPTAISLPDGRYYGRLTLEALESIVNRSGDIDQLESVYRGWGLLPTPLQALERMLLLRHGWDWTDSSVSYRILSETKQPSALQSVKNKEKTSTEKTTKELEEKAKKAKVKEVTVKEEQTLSTEHKLSVEISVSLPEANSPTVYQAELFQDPSKTMHLPASCSSETTSPMIKYTVAQCIKMTSASPAASSLNTSSINTASKT